MRPVVVELKPGTRGSVRPSVPRSATRPPVGLDGDRDAPLLVHEKERDMHRLLRLLRRQALGDERSLARRAERQRSSPSLDLVRRFEREFRVHPSPDDVVFGRLVDPRARGQWLGLTRARLREIHLVSSGATGSGKTTAGMGITREMLRADCERLLNFDPKGDTSAAIEAFVQEDQAAPGGGRIARAVKFIRPFDPNVVPQLRLTAREPGIPSEIQALSLVSSLEEVAGAEMGLRMRSITTPLATLAIDR
jgi:hypothetical protein